MAEETYQQFKIRVTDGKNLSEVDPLPLHEALKSERSEYVDKLKKEHRAAVLARHGRVTKRPIITSEISHGEVGDREEPIVPPELTESPSPSSNKPRPEQVLFLSQAQEYKLRKFIFFENLIASILGIFAGLGIYVFTKEVIKTFGSLYLNYFAQ
jgi:hypothetical protein